MRDARFADGADRDARLGDAAQRDAAPATPTSRRAAAATDAVDEILAAIAFLTRIPVPQRPGMGSRTGAAAYGLVGVLLGAAAIVPVVAIGARHPGVAAVLALAVLAILSGGLHLDGLADTADALAAPGGAADRARTDPRAGSVGVAAIVGVLALDGAALADLAARDPVGAAAALLAGVVASRATAPAWAIGLGRQDRNADGLGAWFARSTTSRDAAVALTSLAIAALTLVEANGIRTALALTVGLIVSVAVGAALVRLRGQLDGDGHGAIIELTLSAVLVAAAIIG